MGSIDTSTKAPVVCVYCGTSAGNSPIHLEQAHSLAQAFHENGIKLVFGGGTSGLMGGVASELVRLSGPEAVHGIIPKAMMAFERADQKPNSDNETKFGKMTVVPDMHTRKKTMVDEVLAGGPGSGFVALSGGYGTMEELMEMVTWNQLGIHDKPVVLLNVDGYYDGLLQWMEKAVDTGFVAKGNSNILSQAKTAEEVVERLKDYEAAVGRLDIQWGEDQ